MSLLDNDYKHYSGIIDIRCARSVADILQEEEDRLGGMPMSGIMWDMVEKRIRSERSKSEQKKAYVWEHLQGQAQKCFEWWVLAGPGGESRLETSMAAGRRS